MNAKHAAARRAVDFVESGTVLGLGSGSTATLAIAEIAERLKIGALHDVVAIPTSIVVANEATRLGIPLTTLEERPTIDVTIDGADEVDPQRQLIKGAGGALLREKIVATATRRLVIVIDASKQVARLGTRYPIPIEVAEFGWSTHLATLRALGAEPVLRMQGDAPYRTDNGNRIIDARFTDASIDVHELGARLRAAPGVIETGLFLDFAPHIVIGADDGSATILDT